MARRETFEHLVTRLSPKGETRKAFSERCGVTTRMLQNYEYGRSKRPHTLTLKAIAEALGCTEDDVRQAVAKSYDLAHVDQ